MQKRKKKLATSKKALKKVTSKKQTKKKPAVKKAVTKRSKPKQETMPVVVNVNDLVKPELHQGKYSMIKTPLSETQLKFIVAPTDPRFIKERPGKGGGKWKYLPGSWFKKRLNFTFGFMWDFDILGERVDGDFITVKGKITVKDPTTFKPMIEKTDFGGAEIKYKKGTKNPLDISNDFKAAATDCLKRCAVQFGFAMDVYGINDLKESGFNIQQPAQPTQVVQSPPSGATPVQATLVPHGNGTDYCRKLIDYVTQNNETVSESEVPGFINMTLGTKYTKALLTNQQLSQQVLAKMLQTK